MTQASLRQILQPRYTAETILGIKGDEPLLIVRELGIANAAIGTIGAASPLAPGWLMTGALVGGIFHGLAGFNHAVRLHRNRLANVAMTSALFVAVVLFASCALSR